MDRREMMIQLKVEKKHPLDIAITKWQDLVDGKDDDANEPNGMSNCALCEVYVPYRSLLGRVIFGCWGCPIKEHTKKRFCRNTPFFGITQQYSSMTRHEQAVAMLALLKMIRAIQLEDFTHYKAFETPKSNKEKKTNG